MSNVNASRDKVHLIGSPKPPQISSLSGPACVCSVAQYKQLERAGRLVNEVSAARHMLWVTGPGDSPPPPSPSPTPTPHVAWMAYTQNKINTRARVCFLVRFTCTRGLGAHSCMRLCAHFGGCCLSQGCCHSDSLSEALVVTS